MTAASVLALVGLAACHRVGAAPARQQPPASVRVAKVVEATVPLELRAIGRVEPIGHVAVKARIGGELTRVWFEEGRSVAAGQTLFTIDPRPSEAAAEAAEAQLARSEALLHKAEMDARRYDDLIAQQLASQEQFDQIRANVEALRASVAVDRAVVKNARLQLSYCTLASPIAGRTGFLTVKAGNVVKADDVGLVTVSQIRPIAVGFAVPAHWLGEIARRRGRSIGVAVTPDRANGRFQGTLSFVDNAVDAATDTILLKATFPNDGEDLWPGQFVHVVVTLGEEAGRVVAPAPAVQAGQKGQYVFVVKSDKTVELRPVTVARMDEREAVVVAGLAAGETVVTEGQLRLLPGTRVEIRP